MEMESPWELRPVPFLARFYTFNISNHIRKAQISTRERAGKAGKGRGGAGTHIEDGEVGEDLRELVVQRLLRVLDLAHVELANAADRVAGVHDGGRLALRARERDVDKVLARRHGLDLLEVVQHHLPLLTDSRSGEITRVGVRGRGGGRREEKRARSRAEEKWGSKSVSLTLCFEE